MLHNTNSISAFSQISFFWRDETIRESLDIDLDLDFVHITIKKSLEMAILMEIRTMLIDDHSAVCSRALFILLKIFFKIVFKRTVS